MSGSSPLTAAVFHILLALADGPLHGYGIMKRVEEEAGLEMGPGTIYGTIQRLADSGWVERAEDQVAEGADQRRGRSFQLTEPGRIALKEEASRIRALAAHATVARLAAEAGT